MPTTRHRLEPGTRVEVTQTMTAGDHAFTFRIVGTVLEHAIKPTGSWYAHAPGGRLRLDRLRIRKDDGEISTLILDGATVVKVLAST